MSSLVRIEGITRHYGAIKALDDVSFDVRAGARHAVIGPNGAGKSTLFGLISGSGTATSGSLYFEDRDITILNEVKRARIGIAQTFQHSSVFLHLSVFDNIALAAQRQLGGHRNIWRAAGADRAVRERVEATMEAIGLTARQDVEAQHLSHGERQQLEVALSLATSPRLLLLDEPTAGMSEGETQRFVDLIQGLPDELTILIIEHDLRVVFALATEVTVLHLGQLLASGSPDEIRENADVQAAYLGDDPRALATMELA